MSETVLAIRDVRKRLGGRAVLQPLSLELAPGRILALCGSNGAGKSTLLRLIAGVLRPDGGSIRVQGVTRAEDRRGYARALGYMPDALTFPAGLSARETLAFFAGLRGLPESRTPEALARVGLAEAGALPARTFSRGMQQRLLFAQALLGEPALLLLDEPTSGLDVHWARTLAAFLTALKASGVATVFSTHQLDLAGELADEVLFLEEGRVIARGPVQEFRARYGPDALTRAFLDALGVARPGEVPE